MDYVFIAAGCVAILTGLFGKKFFYGDEFGDVNRPAPTWSGKLMFSVIGSLFLLLGMLDLFGILTLGKD